MGFYILLMLLSACSLGAIFLRKSVWPIWIVQMQSLWICLLNWMCCLSSLGMTRFDGESLAYGDLLCSFSFQSADLQWQKQSWSMLVNGILMPLRLLNVILKPIVSDHCIILEGDNRITAPKGVAYRVCLGLIPSGEGSWLTAVRALRSEGGILRVHGNVKDAEEELWANHVSKSISEIARAEGMTL